LNYNPVLNLDLPSSSHRIVRNGEGLNHGSFFEGKRIGKEVQIALRNFDQFTIGSVPLETDRLKAFAQVPPPLAAGLTGFAGHIHAAAHPLADLPSGNLLALLDNDPGELVAQDPGKSDAGELPQVGMKVGPAKGTGLDLHQNLIRSDLGNGNRLQAQIFRTVQNCGATGAVHECPSSGKGAIGSKLGA
jgi:hypothetical protein